MLPTMQKWEYLCAWNNNPFAEPWSLSDGRQLPFGATVILLNTLGAEGWHLAEMLPDAAGAGITVYLHRAHD